MEKLISKIRKIFSQKKLMPSGAAWEAESEIIEEVRKHFESKTGAQNRTLWALLNHWFESGMSSFSAKTIQHFKQQVKLELSENPVEKFNRIIDEKGNNLKEPIVDYRIRSFADYTKEEMKQIISAIISNMIQCGINDKKFEEIIKGLDK